MADITIGNMAPLGALSGKEQIPCEIDGKNYKITPDQIAPFVDIANIPTFDSITGQEKVIVVRDGKAQGLVTLTQIRQVVLPGYTYEDLSMNKFPHLNGGISLQSRFTDSVRAKHFEIPIPDNGDVFVIKLIKTVNNSLAYLGFTTRSLEGLSNGDEIPFAGGVSGAYSMKPGETITIQAPADAAFLVVNSTIDFSSTLWEIEWSIQVGELIITTRLNELENRVNTLEQSPAPSNISVSREEFDALKKELDSLKSQMSPFVLGKETM